MNAPENGHPSGIRIGVSAQGTVYWNIEVAAADSSLEAMQAARETASTIHRELAQLYPRQAQ